MKYLYCIDSSEWKMRKCSLKFGELLIGAAPNKFYLFIYTEMKLVCRIKCLCCAKFGVPSKLERDKNRIALRFFRKRALFGGDTKQGTTRFYFNATFLNHFSISCHESTKCKSKLSTFLATLLRYKIKLSKH